MLSFGYKYFIPITACALSLVTSCTSEPDEKVAIPAALFDLRHWSLVLPIDENKDHAADVIRPQQLQNYQHQDYFYLNDDGHMVFTSPNKAATEVTSTNTRSEFRYEIRGSDLSVAESSVKNNWALASHPNAEDLSLIHI